MSDKKELHACVVMTDSYFPLYEKVFNRTFPKEFASVNILHIRDCDARARLAGVGETDFKLINYKKLHY